MFDSSSYVNPTPLAHADASRDVLPRGGNESTDSRFIYSSIDTTDPGGPRPPQEAFSIPISWPRWPSGQDIGSWLACHAFEFSSPVVGVGRRGGTSSGVVLVT
ncbi:hypothetical protein TNCV_3081691 [Trichonephila clavipes]|nr:hypothetical protein TNCV_3081691 [Trichonephila clavipes]